MATKSSKPINTIELPSGATAVIDPDARLKMKDFRLWIAAEKEADLLVVYSYIMPFVLEWSFDFDVDDPESLDELDFVDYQALSEIVTKTLNRSQKRKN